MHANKSTGMEVPRPLHTEAAASCPEQLSSVVVSNTRAQLNEGSAGHRSATFTFGLGVQQVCSTAVWMRCTALEAQCCNMAHAGASGSSTHRGESIR